MVASPARCRSKAELMAELAHLPARAECVALSNACGPRDGGLVALAIVNTTSGHRRLFVPSSLMRGNQQPRHA